MGYDKEKAVIRATDRRQQFLAEIVASGGIVRIVNNTRSVVIIRILKINGIGDINISSSFGNFEESSSSAKECVFLVSLEYLRR
jgi:hypothetical protein